MKQVSKFFISVLALVAYSCTTDITEDLGVGLSGGQDSTTIEISLDGARTHLGEKEGDTYPMYWSLGDQIAVNGTASSSVGEEDAGTTNATFTFTPAVNLPYSVIYPAPADGVAASATEGQYPITFPAVQQYVDGNIAAGVAPMYGYVGEEGGNIKLSHLTGLLRFCPKGEGVTLTSIVVRSESGYIAGTFDIDCAAEGALVAREGAGNEITMSFGDGLALTAEGKPIYIAVPKGNYGIFTVTLNTAADAMVVAFDSEAKPINAGRVREFAAFDYVANADASGEFIIDSKESLIKFSKIASNFAPYTSAKLMAQIDMTGEEWTPIENFGAYTFDGNNTDLASAEGYYIKGLSAPLFGATAATIKNLKLVDVAISESVNPNIGAIARLVTATDSSSPTVSGCYVSGDITVNCPNFVATEDSYDDMAIGGLVGVLQGATLSHSTNEATIEIKAVNSVDSPVSVSVIGGLVGYAPLYGDSTPSLVTNSTNKGAIKHAIGSVETAASYYTVCIGGVLGYTPKENGVLAGTFTENHNWGPITINSYITGGNTHVGGVYGFMSCVTATKSENHNTVSVESGYYRSLQLGGVVSYIPTASVDGFVNYQEGAVTISEGVTTLNILLVGGCIGKRPSDDYTKLLTNIENHAPVSVYADIAAETDKYTQYTRIGGAVGWNQGDISNITNHSTGVVTVSSELHCNSIEALTHIGGAVGYCNSGFITNLSNSAAVNVTADIYVKDDSTVLDQVSYIGGTVGYVIPRASSHITDLSNSGAVSFTGSCEGRLKIGGIAGHIGFGTNSTLLGTVTNSGAITFGENVELGSCFDLGGITGTLGLTSGEGLTITNTDAADITIGKGLSVADNARIGGCLGWTDKAINGITNGGDVTFNGGTFAGDLYLGGCIGNETRTRLVTNANNSGALTLKGTTVSGSLTCIGGCVGTYENNYGGECTNSGNTGAISIDENSNIVGQLLIGGCVGRRNTNSKGNLTNLSNNAPITVKSKCGNNVYIGGVGSYLWTTNNVFRNFTNGENGTITFDVQETTTTEDKIIAISGVGAMLRYHAVSMINKADIYVKGKIQTNIRIAGVVGTANNYDRNTLTNSGDITISAEMDGFCKVGGVKAEAAKGAKRDLINTGNITFTESAHIKGSIKVGGLIGRGNGTFSPQIGNLETGCYNTGNITFNGKSGNGDSSSLVYLGGMIGNLVSSGNMTSGGFSNSGTLSYNGTHNGGDIYVGGVMGYNTKDTSEWVGDLVNTGAVSCDATVASGGVCGNIYVGGIAGCTTALLANFSHNANVAGYNSDYVGMITGTHRGDTQLVQNCKLGGKLALTKSNDEPVWITLYNDEEFYDIANSSDVHDMYYERIYGNFISLDSWTTYNTNFDGCTMP